MDESELRDILYSCKKHNVDETRRRAESALRSSNAVANIRRLTDETLAWLTDVARKLDFDLPKRLRTPVWIVPNPLADAYAVRNHDEDDIVVYEGMFQLLAFIVWLWGCIARTRMLLDKADLTRPDRTAIENQLLEVVKLAVPLCANSVREPTSLPDLRAGLPPAETNTATWHLVGAELFLLLHEQAHVDLGHLKAQSRHTMVHPHFEMTEYMSAYKADEFEADRHTIATLAENRQGYVASGAIWCLTAIVYHESYLSRVSAKHPWAINRMKAILDRYGSNMTDAERTHATELIRSGSDAMTSGKRFGGVPDSEKLKMMFYGRDPNYAAAFIEWFFPFTNEFLMERINRASLD
jgi:hypothetical protein